MTQTTPENPKILVTGGLGFIGSNLICELLMGHPTAQILNIDCETYAGMSQTLAHTRGIERYRAVPFNVANQRDIAQVFAEFKPHYVIHLAAESHVDNSIHGDAGPFWDTNVRGTDIMAREFCLQWQRDPDNTKRMVYVSTDEVYGSLGLDEARRFTEDDPREPNSPYSASKASGELAVRSRRETHAVGDIKPPIIITRCTNNLGPYQFPEKFIPTVILAAASNQPVPVYGNGLNVRDWIHVLDHVHALLAILFHDEEVTGQLLAPIYNIGAESEASNLRLAQEILTIMGKPHSLIEYVTDRPGHDARYALETARIWKDLDWKPRVTLSEALEHTIGWYTVPANQAWIAEAQGRKKVLVR